jgi:glutamine amidotransferase
MRIAVIDLKINNYKSVMVALNRVMNEEDVIAAVESGDSSFTPDVIILPGLGHFRTGMNALEETKLDYYIHKQFDRGSKIVGICLGMQLLGKSSDEAPGIKGLGLIEAKTSKLPRDERIPHVGWNSATKTHKTTHFNTLSKNRDFYFVHSYQVRLTNQEEELASTMFGSNAFTSSCMSENIVGFQFHPEKSGRVGTELLADVYRWAKSPI